MVRSGSWGAALLTELVRSGSWGAALLTELVRSGSRYVQGIRGRGEVSG